MRHDEPTPDAPARHEALADFSVVVSVPVMWADMDAFQHVNNARYLTYFESARITYFERAGVAAASGLPRGVGPILAEASVRFRAPVTYPDTLHIGAAVTALGEDRFTMRYTLVSESLARVAATGTATIVAYDYAAGSKALVPQPWRDAIEGIDGDDALVALHHGA